MPNITNNIGRVHLSALNHESQNHKKALKQRSQFDKKLFNVEEEEAQPISSFSSLPYCSILLFYGLIYWSTEYLGNPAIGLLILHTVIILGDFIVGEDRLNPTEKQSKELADSIYFKIPLYAAAIVDWMFFFWVINHLSKQPFDLVYWIIMLITAGFAHTTNFAVAHELCHKHDSFDRFVSVISLTKMLYTHFFIEHQYGHHKNVATPKDPATARLGETLYQFLPRSIVGSYLSAWDIEKRRLLEIEECSTHWHPKNRMIWYTLSYPAFLGIIYAMFGFAGMMASAGVAFMAVILLETINYTEHYGLERKEIAPGEYEKVSIEHSWNAPHRISNYLLFKIQRHSDHHENAYKPYQTLTTYDKSPLLPGGYSFCMMMAFYPYFWFKIINPLAISYKEGVKLSEAEESKSRKWRILFFAINLTVLIALIMIGQMLRRQF